MLPGAGWVALLPIWISFASTFIRSKKGTGAELVSYSQTWLTLKVNVLKVRKWTKYW